MALPHAAPHVAIVVLNFNGLDDTVRCLESLRQVSYKPLSVIVVDNASTVEPRLEVARVYPEASYIRNAANLGYAGGNNRGIEQALSLGAEFILVLNNDTIVSPAIVDELLAAFAADAALGIVGPVINFIDEPAAVMTDGVAFNPGPGTEFFKRIPVPPSAEPTLVPVDIVNGCCMMVKASLFRKIGMFDERFFIVHEESDFCLRALRADARCGVLSRTLVWHKGSSSFNKTGKQLQRYFDARNLYHLLARHAGKVGRSRRFWPSILHYARYMFYRYDHEATSGKPAAAQAVIEGTYDGITGVFGPYVPRRRIGLGVLRIGFSAARAISRARRAAEVASAPGL